MSVGQSVSSNSKVRGRLQRGATKCVLKLANGGIRSLPAMASWTEWEARLAPDYMHLGGLASLNQ